MYGNQMFLNFYRTWKITWKIISPINLTKRRDFVKLQLYLGVRCNLCSTPFRAASVELRASFYHVPPGGIHRQSSHRQRL